MSDLLPRTTHRELQFENGAAIGLSHRWEKGQYCSILTAAGIVGCGIYDLKTPAEFGQAIAIAKGTPACPLTEPEDLLNATIVGTTPKAESLGIRTGMTGRQAVELMLKATPVGQDSNPVLKSGQERNPIRSGEQPGGQERNPILRDQEQIRVKSIDHNTLVVKDLDASRRFYVDVLGMREVTRPAFSFAGLWFQAGVAQIHLILEFAGSGPAGNLVPPEKRSARTHHVAFLVDDAVAVVPRLRALNVPIVADAKPRPDGYMQVFVADPDGHVIELCSPPK
ncbi:MAG: DUF1805 domain-containing protein [Gemmataceae bacterium]|nr:DUF1805 domain-containing protein [Gemmataceae bacterium]MCI0742399.1 DUF1805 domain-containing protein [Gemmataceae bacterium]